MARTTGDPLRDAFRDQLDAVITAASIPWPVEDTLNMGARPDVQASFIDIEFHGGQEEASSWGNPGNDRYKETGQVMIRLFPASKTGHDTAEGYGLALRNGFRGLRFNMRTGQAVRITAVAPMGDGHNEFGWWCETIALQYRVYNFG